MNDYDAVIIGSGLAGLSCGLELANKGKKVLILEERDAIGGRTSSWDENGMEIESGLHRYLGFYTHLPRLIRKAGLKLQDVIVWEDEIEVRVPGGDRGVVALSPLRKPLKMIKTMWGDGRFLSLDDKLDFIKIVLIGLFDYYFRPAYLDSMTVSEYAEKNDISRRVVERALVPFTEGVFFLPIEKYSAYNLFGLLGPYVPYLWKFGLGAFRGGMTDVLAKPVMATIERRGGELRTGMRAERLIIEGEKVVGIIANGSEIRARHVVVAASLSGAQAIVRNSFGEGPRFENLLSLKSMPAVTLQVDLPEPSAPVDRTTFGPLTSLSSFAEQSRTTFKGARGRISIDLSPGEKFIKMDDEHIFRTALRDGKEIGIDLAQAIRYRVVRWASDFYLLSPGSEALRPGQKTGVQGLTLCGDYTKQRYLCTMEGAVYSGKLASKAVISALK